jgi:cellulose biosynthesis protein BcsQ
VSITIYSFYNNKGGVGKTTLCFNTASLYAENNPETQVLIIDMCPQANISEILLGGGEEGHNNNQKLQDYSSRKNIAGFIDWLLKGNSDFSKPQQSYKVPVNPDSSPKYNEHIPKNLSLIAGDSFLELLSTALNYAVINPGNIDAWKEFMTAIRRLCSYEYENVKKSYKNMVVFIDCNPSFSVYTQMALLSSDKLIIPIMADYSSLKGIKGLFMLLYGEDSSSVSKRYAKKYLTFNKQVEGGGLTPPLIHAFAFNSFTSKEGVVKAFDAVKKDIISFAYDQYKAYPNRFTSEDEYDKPTWSKRYIHEIKDFHTPGKVSSALGIPMYKLKANKYTMPNKDVVEISTKQIKESHENLNDFVRGAFDDV